MRKLAAIFVLVILPLASWSNDKKEESPIYAKDGRALWVAFECSALAGTFNDDAYQAELFEEGYRRGKRFIEAAMDGRIEREDISKTVPLAVLWSIQGPSADFMLGRVYEVAKDSAMEGLVVKNGEVLDEQVTDMLARNKFQEKNCEMLVGS